MPIKYDLPLSDWIAIGLNRERLDLAVKAIDSHKPIGDFVNGGESNRRYISKILKEEVINQFSDSKQPLVQVTLNSLDARPENLSDDYNYNIWLSVGRHRFEATDNGKGMGLEEILRLLVIPFSTEKDPSKTYGWRGVGFLSSLNYCLKLPAQTHILVDTKKEDKGYHLDFYSKTEEIRDLRMAISRKIYGREGTRVAIRGTLLNKESTMEYLKDHLDGIPCYIGRIYLNRRWMNDDKGAKWYSCPVTVDTTNGEAAQQLGFRMNKYDSYGSPHIRLTSQGAKVIGYSASKDATISFPPAAKVVEGWNEFKNDGNFRKCTDAAFHALALYFKDAYGAKIKKDKSRFQYEMLDFVPEMMAAFSLKSIADVPNIDEIKEMLLPGKEYALTKPEYDNLRPFINDSLEEKLFSVSHQAISYWAEVFGREKKLLRDTMSLVDELSADEFVAGFGSGEKKSVLPFRNISILKDVVQSYDIQKIKLVEHSPPGKSCVMVIKPNDNAFLYINVAHSHASGGYSQAKAYSVLSDFMTLHYVANQIIGRDVYSHFHPYEEIVENEIYHKIPWLEEIPAQEEKQE